MGLLTTLFGVMAVATVGAAAAFIVNRFSERERARQQRLKASYERYRKRVLNKDRAIRNRYNHQCRQMRNAAADELYDYYQNELEELKEENRADYEDVMSCAEEQMADAKEKIDICKKFLEQLKSHLDSQQVTPLRQQTLLSARSSLHDFIHEEYAYIGYLSKYIHRLQYVYNRQGEIIEPFSIHLPEEVPYKNKVICVEREKLDGDCFDIEVGDSLYYKACCEDPENLSYYSGMDRIYCLVTDNKKTENGSVKVLSCAKGMFIQTAIRQKAVCIDAVVEKIMDQENSANKKYEMTYKGVTLHLNRFDCENRRIPVIGEHRRVYVKYWNYSGNFAQVTEKYDDVLKVEFFDRIPLVIGNSNVADFKKEAQKLTSSMDDWYIGPMEDKGNLKVQLGTKAVFVVSLKEGGNPDNPYIYFTFDHFLKSEEMFRFNDIYVVVDAQLEAVNEKKEQILPIVDNTRDLIAYLQREFTEQEKIKKNQSSLLFFNQWNEVMRRLIEIKKYGKKEIQNIHVKGCDNPHTWKIDPMDIPCVQHFLKEMVNETARTRIIIQLHNGRGVDGKISENGGELLIKEMVMPEELREAGNIVDLYEQAEPYPEQQQYRALEQFRLGQMVNPKLKTLIFDLPSLTFTDNGRQVREIRNSKMLANHGQLQALNRANSSENIFLIQGPPGTGKTTLIKELIYQELTSNPDSRILIVSQANVAVDNVLRGLAEQIHISPAAVVRCGRKDKISEDLQDFNFENRFEQYISSMNADDLPKELVPYQQKWLEMLQNPEGRSQLGEYLLNNFSIIGATCVGLAQKRVGLDRLAFDLVIIDEAGKALPGELLIPINRARKVIIIGDHKQLPPVIDPALYNGGVDLNDVVSEDDENKFFSTSFFQYLYEQCPSSNKFMLDMQYRMPTVIGNLVSRLFYDGQLKSAASCALKTPLMLDHHLIFLNMENDAAYVEQKESPQSSPYNMREVEIVADFVHKIREKYDKRIVIITPYKGQKKKLRNKFKNEFSKDDQIHIDTIDAFQGDESDIVIYCMTRSRTKTLYFSDNARLNVALSRTKNTLIIVGSLGYLYSYGEGHNLTGIADYIKENGLIITFDELMNSDLGWRFKQDEEQPNNSETGVGTKESSEEAVRVSPEIFELETQMTVSRQPAEEERKTCAICHKLFSAPDLLNDICPDCLNLGKIYKCKRCHRKMLYTNYRKYVEKLSPEPYCKNCSEEIKKNELVMVGTCESCGKEIKVKRGYLQEHPEIREQSYCYECNRKISVGICEGCGRPIEVKQGYLRNHPEAGQQKYCYECNRKISVGICEGCGRPIEVKQGYLRNHPEIRRTKYCYECNQREVIGICANCGRKITAKKGYLRAHPEMKQPKYCHDCYMKRKWR